MLAIKNMSMVKAIDTKKFCDCLLFYNNCLFILRVFGYKLVDPILKPTESFLARKNLQGLKKIHVLKILRCVA
jgi:hypothetical protein